MSDRTRPALASNPAGCYAGGMHGRDAIGGLIDAKGHIRTAWRPVVDAMQAIGAAEFAARAATLDRRTRFDQPSGVAAVQRLDPIPVPLMDYEFASLAAGIVERAECLAALLDDVYGAQTCVAAGLMPGARLFGEAEFVRYLARQPGFRGQRLAFYAVDLVRDAASGGFAVLRDHTDQATGLGLAMSIRRSVAEVMPELFGKVTLASQRPVIESLQDWLHDEAGGGPIGLIAGGTADFADARLLARQIGAMVLRPDDLSCIGGALRLRTLAGSLPVRLLLRMGTSHGIDPLEQGGVPSRGVAGLFRVLRSNAGVMLNAPGSGVVGAPWLGPLLEPIFERRLGRAPRLRRAEEGMVTGLDADQAPVAGAGHFDFATMTLRLFALRIDEVWRVLPGGLGLARRADGSTVIKDVWVIDSGESDHGSVSPPHRAVPRGTRRLATDLPSRLADDLLWLGRMVERLDAGTRLLRLTLPRFIDASSLPHEAVQRVMLGACLVKARLLPDETTGPFLTARRLHEALAKRLPLTGLLQEVRRLLDQCGERFSVSMRELVQGALDRIPTEQDGDSQTHAACLGFVATFNGVVAEDASRSGGFVFLEIGRRLERAEALAETLAILLDGGLERLDPGLALAIELADAQLTYEFIHAAPISPVPAVALLVGAVDYPRSIAFQTAALEIALRRIDATDEAAAAARMTARLQGLALSLANARAGAEAISEVLTATRDEIEELSDRLTARYFAPVPPAHQVDRAEG